MAEAKFASGPWEIRKSPTQIGTCFRIGTPSVLDGGHGAIILYDDKRRIFTQDSFIRALEWMGRYGASDPSTIHAIIEVVKA